MKKLIAITLLLCLIAACVPALGQGAAAPRGEAHTVNLTGGPVTFYVDYFTLSSDAEFLRTEYYKINASLEAARESGVIRVVDQTDMMTNTVTGETTQTLWYDVDLDGAADVRADVIYVYLEGEGAGEVIEDTGTLILEKVQGSSVAPAVAIRADGAPWNPLTFKFADVYAEIVNHCSYQVGGGSAVFMKPEKKDAASLTIPATITVNGETVRVVAIADNACKGMKKLAKVKIGANIKEVGKNAFANCAKLKTVSGGAGIETIGDSAFSGCKALKSAVIGAKVDKIGKKAFYKCAGLKKITIKSRALTAKSVGANAFKGIDPRATIKVPKAVKKEYTKWLLKKGVKKTMKIK